jgi:hypothetical protein
LTKDVESDLRILKDNYSSNPRNTWIIDFEYITLTRGASIIPVQFAIRQLNGDLLLANNVEYDLTLVQFLDRIGSVQDPKKHMGSIFTRCYNSLRTNGLKPSQIRNEIIRLGYDPNNTKILSWYSSLDMQCFERLLSKGNDLVVSKHSHLSCSNFQGMHLGMLCKQLLPRSWPSMTLQVVHSSLLASRGQTVDDQFYHTAVNDTKAVTDIIQVIISLV